MFEEIRELSNKIKVVIGLGLSGLFSLIGYCLKNWGIQQYLWAAQVNNSTYISPINTSSLASYASFQWEFLGTRIIHPLADLGSVLLWIGFGMFLLTLLFIPQSQMENNPEDLNASS